jgi:hypothetical protein
MKNKTKHFCNDCKYYRPLGNTNGLCGCEFASGVSVHHFYDKSCPRNFKLNLFYWHEVESPEFMELYERNIEIKAKLKVDINAYRYAQQISREIDKEILKTIIAQKLANTPETKNKCEYLERILTSHKND